jgi:hypothetical protein
VKVYTDDDIKLLGSEYAKQNILHYVDSNGHIATNIDEDGNGIGTVYPVYAYDYELTLNERKREIKVVSRDVLTVVLQNFRTLV